MKKRSVEPVLKRQYKSLHKSETKLQKQLARLHKAHTADIAAIITTAYIAASVGDKLSHAALLDRISPAEAARLARDTKRLRGEAPDTEAFPFSVLHFDRLNRLDGIRASLILSEYNLAAEEERLIMAHLQRHSELSWQAFESWLDYHAAPMTAAAIAAILRDKQYPVSDTIYRNHRSTAEQTIKKIEQNIIRGNSDSEAIKDITAYVSRREKARSDSVIFYEGTRVTIETLGAVTRNIADYFRSITIKDGKACQTCKDIEVEQIKNPIPINDMVAGVTAPPFHNYCRCGIEVIYRDDNKTS